MRLSQVKEILNAAVLCGSSRLEEEVTSCCGSDFLSDVLAYVHDQNLLLTGMVNSQVIRTAEMTDIKCVVFVRGKQPGEDIVRLAQERDIVVMTSGEQMYTACGLLYSNGLRGN
ncbi:hypothetical protein D1159_08915 [Pseudoflavonifractor sp. 524-17]|uniref:DRTGG domain-containing protein n=1 Tax=Pseudoflavonifractor sp. 524-17 TaxID=2304577 RepID=UPI001379C254|nr:DRTGG domain-containing protein [Pseudoflavonifractor sp. 524-17]NCE64703.1 hypothetical protein [Pseudoflavonifractor sp. 524-17]